MMESEQYMDDNVQPQMMYTADALHIKLDPTEAINRIENFLKGERPVIEDDRVVLKKIGAPLANPVGIQKIMQTITMIVGKDTVMGNLEDFEINQIIYDVKVTLAGLLATYCEEWGIDRSDRIFIVNNIEWFVKVFLSRTKNDGERKSLGMRVQHSSSAIEKDKKFNLNPFGRSS